MAKQQNEIDELDKPRWSHRNLAIIVSFFVGTVLQTLILYFTLTQSIHDEITNRLADYRVMDIRVSNLEAAAKHDGPISYNFKIDQAAAIVPGEWYKLRKAKRS